MTEHRIHAWKLRSTSLGCMACQCIAQVVVNVWVQDRDWLVLFLCPTCALRARGETTMLQGFLGEKRVREREAREFDAVCKKRKRGMAA
jgi:hypothetical protein